MTAAESRHISPRKLRKKKPVNNGLAARRVHISPKSLRFGDALTECLEQVGWSRKFLIEARDSAGDLLFSEDTVKSWLNNRSVPRPDNLLHIENWLIGEGLDLTEAMRLRLAWRSSQKVKFVGEVGATFETACDLIDEHAPPSVFIVGSPQLSFLKSELDCAETPLEESHFVICKFVKGKKLWHFAPAIVRFGGHLRWAEQMHFSTRDGDDRDIYLHASGPNCVLKSTTRIHRDEIVRLGDVEVLYVAQPIK